MQKNLEITASTCIIYMFCISSGKIMVWSVGQTSSDHMHQGACGACSRLSQAVEPRGSGDDMTHRRG